MLTLAADRPEFAPPPQRGTPRALILALIAHALLIAALTWGVHWRRDSQGAAIEAELWSSTVQQAAPRAVQPPTPPEPVPAPPPPPPPPQAATPPEPMPAPRAPDIALEREKKIKEEKERRERELEQQAQKKRQETERRAAQEKEAKKREQEEAERKKLEQEKLAEEKKKKEAQTQQVAKDRQEQLRRLQALAGTGSADSQGTAARASGPSGNYAARVAAAVRPNIVYPDAETSSANPRAEFDVRLAPDGTIVGIQLKKSSGVPAWDQAAERALRKTDKLPRDTDGRVYPSLTVGLRPKD